MLYQPSRKTFAGLVREIELLSPSLRLAALAIIVGMVVKTSVGWYGRLLLVATRKPPTTVGLRLRSQFRQTGLCLPKRCLPTWRLRRLNRRQFRFTLFDEAAWGLETELLFRALVPLACLCSR